MAQIPVNVTMDGNDNIRCNPDPIRARRGDNTIVWRASSPGVTLEAIDIDQGPGKPVWPGSRPQKQTDGSICADDPVTGSQVQTFKYSVTVSKGGQTYSVDPEIKNDPNG